MKKALLNFLFILGLSTLAVAQNFSLETDTMFLNIDLNSDEEFTCDIINEMAVDLLLSWEITNFDVPGSWDLRICDNKACYDNEDGGSIPSAATMNPIIPESYAFIKLRAKPYDNAFYGKIEFFIYEEGDQANGQLLVFILNAGGLSIGENIVDPTVIYPNPVKDDLYLTFANNQINLVRILDAQGRVVAEQTIFGSVQKFNMNAYEDGMYLIQTYTKNRQLLESIPVIKH